MEALDFGPCSELLANEARDRWRRGVVKFLLWCILLVLCWPLALLALIVYPRVWIFLIPFRLVGIAVDGLLGLLRSIVMLPLRLVNGPRAL